MRQGRMITLEAPDGAAIGCYSVTAQAPRRGGLVLVMEIFGVTDHIKELCDGYAAEGFDVLSPALYDRMERDFEAAYSPEDIARSMKLRDGLKMETAIGDVQMCIDALKRRGAAPVFATGYCYGGSVVWVAACRCDGLAAVSSYYGRFVVDHVGETPKCPVVLHFGRNDKSIPMEWVERIQAAHPDVPVYVYEARHGFNSDRRTDYDATCARLARERTLALFHDQHR